MVLIDQIQLDETTSFQILKKIHVIIYHNHFKIFKGTGFDNNNFEGRHVDLDRLYFTAEVIVMYYLVALPELLLKKVH